MLKWDDFIHSNHIWGIIFQPTPSVQTMEIDFYNYALIINSTWPAPIFNISAYIVSYGNHRVLLRLGYKWTTLPSIGAGEVQFKIVTRSDAHHWNPITPYCAHGC